MTTRPLPTDLQLEAGSHDTPDDGMCLLEAVAYVAGEPHSAYPECASEVIAVFGRTWNDSLDTDQRQRLIPYINRLVGSRGTNAQEITRSWMAFDWLVRTHLPAWLRLAGLDEHADDLVNLSEITDEQTLEAAMPVIAAARTAATAAAEDAWVASDAAARIAVRDTFRDAVRDAIKAAAWTAASDAGGTAWDTWDAAWGAWNAARGAADAAALRGTDLTPTRDELIESAHDLLDRMLNVSTHQAAQ